MKKIITIAIIAFSVTLMTSGCKSETDKKLDEISAIIESNTKGFRGLSTMMSSIEESGNLDGTFHSAEDVILSLKNAKLPISYYIQYTDETDPNGPRSKISNYLSKANFADSRLETIYSEREPLSGSVELFDSKEKAIKRSEYINQFSALDHFQYQIIADKILLRLNTNFTLDQVKDYANAINGEIHHTPKTTPLAPNNSTSSDTKPNITSSIATPSVSTIPETTSQKNALRRAKAYLDVMSFSHSGLVEQLEFEQYSHEDAVYAADHCGADWNQQAVRTAKTYLDTIPYSRNELIEQLEFEGFTHEQAVYGVNSTGL